MIMQLTNFSTQITTQKNKIDRKELKDSIKNIINEGLRSDLRETPDMTSVFGIKKYINGLVEQAQKNPKLMSYVMRFNESLSRGAKDFMLFEQFGKGLEQFATGNKVIKGVINEMNSVLEKHGTELQAFKLIENIKDDYVRENIRETYNEYLADPCDETKSMVLEANDNLFNLNESQALQMNLYITNTANNNPQYFSTSYVTESSQEDLNKRLKEDREKKLSNDIFKKVERYLDERFNQEDEKKQYINEKYSLNGIANKNGLNLLEKLNKVLKSDAAKNEGLKNIVLEYSNALANGAYEERLYETLLQATSKYDYLLPVDKMRKAILETANKNRQQIELTKILEEMRDSYNSYIYVELIQEDVARYVENPNAINRVQLQNALMPYAADPYINEMFKIIYSDDSYDANAITEKAMSIKDQLSIIQQNASVSNIYTPVQYIRENESIFNVRGQYYVKKGNNISVLDKKYIPQLNERFVELCHLVNDPHVEICEDHITLHGTENTAKIYEGYVDINGYKEDAVSLRRLDEMCMKYENYDTNFYIMCSCLLENFNNIAKIDWAKHITLNSNEDITADIFKLNENIYMATHNNSLMKHTFYRNVNPIFCKNTLNEHMGINVSSLFSDLLPEQDKIILRLNETKNQYEKSIEDYEKAIENLKDAKTDANDEDIKKQLDDAIEDSEKKLADLKDEYKKWQEETDDQLTDTDAKDADASDDTDDDTQTDADDNAKEKGDSADADVKHEINNEPLTDDEVDANKEDFSTPLTGNEKDNDTDASEPVDDETITDDEFSNMLATDATDDTVNPDDDTDADADDSDNSDDTADDSTDADSDTDLNLNTDADDSDDSDVADDDKEEFNTVDVDNIDGTDAPEADTDDDDDDIFAADDETGVSDDVPTEPAAEDVPSDEDIVIGDDDDDDETTDTDDAANDMQTVDAETGKVDDDTDNEGEAATDLFGGDVKDPLGTDKTIEPELYNPHTETSEFSIVNVMFDGNEKDHTTMKSGEVMILRPMVAADGSRYVDTLDVHFYLNDADNVPVIQSNEAMSTAMYNAIVDAITSHPQYNDVCKNGIPVSNTEVSAKPDADIDDVDTDDWETEYAKNASDEDKGNFEIGDDVDSSTDTDELPSEIDTDDVDDAAESRKADDDALSFNIDDDTDTDTTDASTAVPDDVTVTVDTDDNSDADDTADDDIDFGEIFGDLDDDSDTADNDPVQVEKDDDGTEIEVPAQISDTTPDDADDDAVDTDTADATQDLDDIINDVTSDDDSDDTDADTDDDTDDSSTDDSIIPENYGRKMNRKKKINENRKSILSIKVRK